MIASKFPPNFTVDNGSVLHLFTGEHFYSESDAALREAVLNSIDAVIRRQFAEPSLDPNIRVEFSDKRQTVTIIDNGDGMDAEAISTLFTRVGASASRVIAKNDGRRTSTIGQFGIGALSYFLVCDTYNLYTVKAGSPPVGLVLSSEMLDGVTDATEIPCERSEIGTTLVLFIKTPEILGRMRERYHHWFRSVEGLEAVWADTGEPLAQGGLTKAIRQIPTPDIPSWIDRAEIGPPQDVSLIGSFDGRGHVDVLYRGVFVERIEIDQLWALEGAVHVDPKHFKPKLNREGFVGQGLKAELEPVLRRHHPSVLKALLPDIEDLLTDKQRWSEYRAISLWLAVPRGGDYGEVAALWDSVFRRYRAFRLLDGDDQREASIDELIALNADRLYVAPDKLEPNSLVSQAVRVLRAQGRHIIQGVIRENGFMSAAAFNSTSSTWLLSNFGGELPERVQVDSVADETLFKESLAEIYTSQVTVRAIKLGTDAAPFVAVKGEVWINIESESGKSIVSELCARNQGHLGLWSACMLHAPDSSNQLTNVASALRRASGTTERLGLVRRQYLRSLIS